jgi:hypothetical protein
MAIEKNKILCTVLEPIQPIWLIFAVNGLDWQCCFTGSSKMAHRILIFSIAMGADYSFELNSIET